MPANKRTKSRINAQRQKEGNTGPFSHAELQAIKVDVDYYLEQTQPKADRFLSSCQLNRQLLQTDRSAKFICQKKTFLCLLRLTYQCLTSPE